MTNEQLTVISKDPKTFLLQGRKAKELINAKRERINSWRKIAESITVPIGKDGGGNSGGYTQSIVENASCSIVDLENEIVAEIAVLAGIEREVQKAISELIDDDRYKAVLEMRYLNGYSWRTIGAKLYYGEDWVCRLHGMALQQMKSLAASILSYQNTN